METVRKFFLLLIQNLSYCVASKIWPLFYFLVMKKQVTPFHYSQCVILQLFPINYLSDSFLLLVTAP